MRHCHSSDKATCISSPTDCEKCSELLSCGLCLPSGIDNKASKRTSICDDSTTDHMRGDETRCSLWCMQSFHCTLPSTMVSAHRIKYVTIFFSSSTFLPSLFHLVVCSSGSLLTPSFCEIIWRGSKICPQVLVRYSSFSWILYFNAQCCFRILLLIVHTFVIKMVPSCQYFV